MNVVVIGSGHYVMGRRDADETPTDKDLGVVLPTLAILQHKGLVQRITVVGRDGSKLHSSLSGWRDAYYRRSRIEPRIDAYPLLGRVNEKAYKDVLKVCSQGSTVVFVATPDSSHQQIVMDVLQFCFPVFIVKPLVTNVEAYESIRRRLDELARKVFVYIDFHKVFDSQNILLKQRIDSGVFGNIQLVQSVQTQRRIMKLYYKKEITSNSSFNVNHYLGCHYIHQTAYMTAGQPKTVRAVGYGGSPSSSLSGPFDLVHVQIDWDSQYGTFTSLHTSGWNDPNIQPYMTRQNFSMITSHGSASLVQDCRGYSECVEGAGYNIPNPHFFGLPTEGTLDCFEPNSYYGTISITHFIDKARRFLAGEVTYEMISRHPNSFESSLVVTKILGAADESLYNGSPIIAI